MNVSELKLVNFEKTVINEAERKRDEALEEIAAEKKKKISAIKKALEEEAAVKLKRECAKISKEHNEIVVQKHFETKRELLEERCRRIDELFGRIESRLREFVASPAYEKYLTKAVSDSKSSMENISCVMLSGTDERYAPELEGMGFAVEYTDEDFIGGCLVIDHINGRRLDETLATRMSAAKESFLELYNLKIEV